MKIEQKYYKKLASNQCPICKVKGQILEGPQGGCSVNVKCDACKQRFNVTPILNIAERIQ